MKIWIVGNSTIGFELKARRRTLPKFYLVEADMPEIFSNVKEVLAWRKAWRSKISRHLKSRGHTVVVCPAIIATPWGEMLPMEEMTFDVAVVIGNDVNSRMIAAKNATILKTIRSKSVAETLRALLAFLRELL